MGIELSRAGTELLLSFYLCSSRSRTSVVLMAAKSNNRLLHVSSEKNYISISTVGTLPELETAPFSESVHMCAKAHWRMSSTRNDRILLFTAQILFLVHQKSL